jgi:aminoglycoside N3'-acetyltransferase
MSSTQYPTVSVRITRPVRTYKTGQVVGVTGGLADMLVRSGYAVRNEQPQIRFAVADEPQEVERAEAPYAKAGRRRRAGK